MNDFKNEENVPSLKVQSMVVRKFNRVRMLTHHYNNAPIKI